MNTQDWLQRYRAVRSYSQRLCAPLAIEDHVPQPTPEVSPPKWHLAHTSWFFETMLLVPHLHAYQVFDPQFGYLFNSYYESVGERWLRAQRGHLSRPTVAQVYTYRAYIDAAIESLISRLPSFDAQSALKILDLLELGLQHEQQHQELLLTDLKFILSVNPGAPAYDGTQVSPLDVAQEHQAGTLSAQHQNQGWINWNGGLRQIGHAGPGFSFDNEKPAHKTYVPAVQIRTTLVSNYEYLEFMQAGGYQRFEFWHAQGWDWVKSNNIGAPLYWQQLADQWQHYTLQGLQPLPADAPVSHVSYYEAYAYCQWAGCRLPTEFEWETLCASFSWGQRWEWTGSAYLPYPGFRTAAGAVGEYNGKFMVGQQVLRGASFATPVEHVRLSYRNFFQPELRWQYTGIRLARDAEVAHA